jgi:hypothetical protein
MTEERHRLLDIVFKAVTAAVTLLALWAGYQQFITEFERSNRTPFVEMQSKYYLELLEVVAKASHPKDDAERAEAVRRFWQLYVGPSALVEDKLVEEKTSLLSLCLKRPQGCPQLELEAHSLALSGAIRTSLVESWGLKAGKD